MSPWRLGISLWAHTHRLQDRPSPCPATLHPQVPSILQDMYQLLEEVSHPLLVTPLLHTREEPIIELFVNLIELRHFKEDGLNLLAGQHRLRSGSSCFQRLHGLEEDTCWVAQVNGYTIC